MQSGSCKIRMRNSGILTEIKHIHTYKPYSLAFARSMRFQGTRTTYLHIQVHMYALASRCNCDRCIVAVCQHVYIMIISYVKYVKYVKMTKFFFP